jgi:hypothetical protein
MLIDWKPPPTGVVKGPFKARPVRRIFSKVPAGRGIAELLDTGHACHPSFPGKWRTEGFEYAHRGIHYFRADPVTRDQCGGNERLNVVRHGCGRSPGIGNAGSTMRDVVGDNREPSFQAYREFFQQPTDEARTDTVGSSLLPVVQ